MLKTILSCYFDFHTELDLLPQLIESFFCRDLGLFGWSLKIKALMWRALQNYEFVCAHVCFFDVLCRNDDNDETGTYQVNVSFQ